MTDNVTDNVTEDNRSGVKLSKRQSLKALLTSFGHELCKSGKVELKKEAGLTRTDIVHL